MRTFILTILIANIAFSLTASIISRSETWVWNKREQEEKTKNKNKKIKSDTGITISLSHLHRGHSILRRKDNVVDEITDLLDELDEERRVCV